MGGALIYSTSILTAFLGGILALFAPCCIVSLGPAYLAGALSSSRGRLVERTGLFALGVAAVLLPIVLGLGALGVLLNQAHRGTYFVGGLLMLAMGLSAVAGKGWTMPMPMMHRPRRGSQGMGGMFLLGVFSGVVSSCCAPVLGGVLVLSVTAGSLLRALALGAAYVAGMVFPLFLAALLWERLHLDRANIFRGRMVSVPVAGRRIQRTLPEIGASVLFLSMGGLMLGLSLTGRSTYAPPFLIQVSRWGSSQLGMLADRLAGIPDWALGLGLIALISVMIVAAWPRPRQSSPGSFPLMDEQQRRVVPGSCSHAVSAGTDEMRSLETGT